MAVPAHRSIVTVNTDQQNRRGEGNWLSVWEPVAVVREALLAAQGQEGGRVKANKGWHIKVTPANVTEKPLPTSTHPGPEADTSLSLGQPAAFPKLRLTLETETSDQKACCSDEIWPPEGSKQATAFPGKSSQLSIQGQF
ncbi:Histone-Lysine N-Methyltransferase Setd1A [Manis pentadactyla]|nr:Histone-Lysine N-Methyltransferase Setd1A [Manis pentadactyla]